jgi:predicted phosphodiesterase
MIGFIGDVHGRYESLFKIFESHPEVTRWFQVGDLGGEDLPYPDLPSNFHFIQGNHENWNVIASLVERGSTTLIQNGDVRRYQDGNIPYTIGALGGNYSSRFYGSRRRDLCGDRRRHFVAQEVESLVSLAPKLDIFITHEAPVPFQKHGRELGQPIITELLKKTCPDTHFFGHHHYYRVLELEGTVTVGLEYASQSYVLYDVVSGRIDRRFVS